MLAKMIFRYGLSGLSRLGPAVAVDLVPRVSIRRLRQSAALGETVQAEASGAHHNEHFTAGLWSRRRSKRWRGLAQQNSKTISNI